MLQGIHGHQPDLLCAPAAPPRQHNHSTCHKLLISAGGCVIITIVTMLDVLMPAQQAKHAKEGLVQPEARWAVEEKGTHP